ncbi:hypothetical protein M9H77_12131 [Catharanthus roseus]|uniref:Uncharacterized protein n=1 Tax=Catharanthus roseus TaxID=4058 RepID=A0ACC0BGJ1_CATRO|nr:hypothetical protein M9H77_12131 [Catharanthus roseus]
MDPEQLQRRDPGLGPVTNRSGRTHGRTVTTSSRGHKGRHNTSNVPTTPSYEMFHRFDASRSSVPPPPLSTRPQSQPSASSSFDPNCDRSYIDRIHQHPIRESSGAQLAVEHMSSYAPGLGQYFGQYHCRESDEPTVQARRDGESGDVEGEVQGKDVQGDYKYGEEEGSE